MEKGRQITALEFEKEIGIKCGAINTQRFGFDGWAIKNTVQEFVFFTSYERDRCYTTTSLHEARPRGRSRGGKGRSASRGRRRPLLHWAGWQSFLLVPKESSLFQPLPSKKIIKIKEKKSFNTVIIPTLLQEEVSILKHLSNVLLLHISVYVWSN